MRADLCEDRQIIAVGGEERRDFLQGLVSNDVNRLDQGLVYAALLTPQGKYLADFFLVPLEEAIGLDVKAELAPGLMQRLGMYKLRSKVTLEPRDLPVWRGTGPAPEGALADPRDPSLGWRHYGALEAEPAGIDWDALRVAACVPETGVELLPNDSYLLESGFERLNGVDFRKGCYVGQEVTARMKHKTELKKGLVPVEVAGAAPVGAEIRAGEKVAGRLYTQSGGRGIAYLRLDRAQGEMTAEGASVRLAG
jgi:hypothetical protein